MHITPATVRSRSLDWTRKTSKLVLATLSYRSAAHVDIARQSGGCATDALSENTLIRAGGRRVDEGVTEYVRMKVQGSVGPGVHTNYADDFAAITAIEAKGGRGADQAIRDAYFKGTMGPFRSAVEAAVDRTTLEYYRNRLKNDTRPAWARVASLLPSGVDRAGAWEMWSAFGRGDFGDVLGYLINWRRQPVPA